MVATSTSNTPTPSSVRLIEKWTKSIRWLWIAFTILAIIIFAMSMVAVYQESLEICEGDDCVIFNMSPDDASFLEELGVPHETPAMIETLGGVITALVYVLIAGIIIFRRPDELIAIVTAFAFVAMGLSTSISGLQTGSSLWDAGIQSITAVSVIGLTGFLFTFPNGRFVPRWTQWLFIVLIPVNIIITIATIFDFLDRDSYFNLLILQLLLPFLMQVYRYFRIAKPAERQQMKWVVAAVFVQILLGVFNGVIYGVVFNYLAQDASTLTFVIIVIYLLSIRLLVITLPLAILISIMRYRLWDIDFYINRGIIYLSLTVLLGVVFTGIFFLLQLLFNSLLGSSQPALALIVPTAVVFGLFNPARTRLRHFVDRRLYGIKMDYTRVIESRQRILQELKSATTIGQYRTSTILGKIGRAHV